VMLPNVTSLKMQVATERFPLYWLPSQRDVPRLANCCARP
jgi:hypothetical protein